MKKLALIFTMAVAVFSLPHCRKSATCGKNEMTVPHL